MINKDFLRIAMEQSAEDIGCSADDFLSTNNILVPFKLGENAKRFYKLPIGCAFVSFGNNVVAAATEELSDVTGEYIKKFEFYHCFEYPNLKWLNDHLAPFEHVVFRMAEYYLPDLKILKRRPCEFELRVLEQADFDDLYLPEWSNALCSERKHLDVLGVGAYDGTKLVGLAGCSSDTDDMWQIGVDVLPEYRRHGIASAVTSALTMEILDRDKVPFYSTAWSNIRSAGNAIKNGFLPTWVEMSAKPFDVVDEVNRESASS